MNFFQTLLAFYATLFLRQGSQPIPINGWNFCQSGNPYTALCSSSVESLLAKLSMSYPLLNSDIYLGCYVSQLTSIITLLRNTYYSSPNLKNPFFSRDILHLTTVIKFLPNKTLNVSAFYYSTGIHKSRKCRNEIDA